jgi:hypothetical protein
VTPPAIPSWKERLKACFQWRHRLLHVFGLPMAIGAVTAVGAASALTPDVGLSLGILTAGVGSVLYGYYVTAGFDGKLVRALQDESQSKLLEQEHEELNQALALADPMVRPVLHRILFQHHVIESAFADGIDDSVEAVLQGSRQDLRELRDRALQLSKLHQRLGTIIQGSDGRWLAAEVERMDRELKRTPEGAVRDALLQARDSTLRTFDQWQAAFDKQRQVASVLTVIEKNLEEFKLAMELRKADAAISTSSAPDVSELQARLMAAGQACDELVSGRRTERRRRDRGSA